MEKHDNVPQWRPLGCKCEEVEVFEGYGGGCSEKSRWDGNWSPIFARHLNR